MGECPKCKGTGLADSGGFQSWGEPILIECDCKFEEAIVEQMRSEFEAWWNSAERGLTIINADVQRELQWAAWVASRAAIEIELPSDDRFCDDEAVSAVNDCADIIRAAGLRVKER